MTIEGRQAGTLRLERTIPFRLCGQSQVGRDYDIALTGGYRVPFVYPGADEAVEIGTRCYVSRPCAADQHGASA